MIPSKKLRKKYDERVGGEVDEEDDEEVEVGRGRLQAGSIGWRSESCAPVPVAGRAVVSHS